MDLCNKHNSKADGVRIPVDIAWEIAEFPSNNRLPPAASGKHGQLRPCLDPPTKAICIGPSEPDRACSTHALHVPHSTDPVTGHRLIALGMKCSELATRSRENIIAAAMQGRSERTRGWSQTGACHALQAKFNETVFRRMTVAEP
jgi:hypothetical protein